MKKRTYPRMKKWAAAAAATLMLAACDKDGLYPGGSLQEGPIECLVLNEGLINTNEGCLSVVYRDSTVVVDAFQDANHRPMGDVAQSVTLINGKYFVAMNNSKKVEVMDPTTFQSLGTILYTRAGYPRQIVPISDTEAVVSDLRSQLVRIRTVEPYGEPLEYIPLPTNIEYLAAAENKIFGMTSRGVMVFDADHVTADEARLISDVKNEEQTKTCRMLKDKNGDIWALTNNREGSRIAGVTLSRIDPAREQVAETHTLTFLDTLSAAVGDPVAHVNYNRTDIDPTGTYIYFNVMTKTAEPNDEGACEQQSVYRFDIDNATFELYRHLPGVGMMYGFAVGPTGDVYLCDCLDYTAQRGYVRCYRADGTVDSYRVGVYPSQVYFPGYEY